MKPGSREKTEASVAVIGAGPAGLFACDCLVSAGIRVEIYDRMQAPLCKFMVAGAHGGLNISNRAFFDAVQNGFCNELSDTPVFSTVYGDRGPDFARFFSACTPADFERWLARLGCALHEGSGGKLFPDGVDAPEIARRWKSRLAESGLFAFHSVHSLVSLGSDGSIGFLTPDGAVSIRPEAAIFALGGASWPSTGSDGSWAELFAALGCEVTPLESSNCGFEADWPPFVADLCAGVPVKNVTLAVKPAGAPVRRARGELVLTPYGMEGSLVYALGREIRRGIAELGKTMVFLDLVPDLSLESVRKRLGGGPGKASASTWLKKAFPFDRAVVALMREKAGADRIRDPEVAAQLVKNLPVTLYRARPIAEAISSAGGLSFGELDESLMLKRMPGWFCAGEMLDWDAPTGGFLMQGCFATAFSAAKGAAKYLDVRNSLRS